MSFFTRLGAGMLVGATLTAAVAGSAEAQTVRWRMTQAFPDTSNFYTLFALPFIERVKLLTDGQVVIQPFPAGVIAPSFQAYDAVMEGTADAGQSSAVYIVNRDPANAILNVFPGGMGPEALSQWMWKGGGKELLAGHRRETMGLHSIPAGLGATELFAHSRRKIQTLEDFKGLKFRTAGSFADVLKEMGAVPTVVPGNEVYTMLERGAIDAAEWSGPAENLKIGLQETSRFISYPGVHTNAFFQEFFIKASTWDKLPKATQDKIEAAAMLSSMDTLMAFDALDREAWKKMRAGKNEINRLDDAVVVRIRELGRKWVLDKAAEQTAAGKPWMKRIADSYFKFHDDWLENAEYRAIDQKARK